MLQFNKSEATNTNAVWIDTVSTASDAYSNIGIVYSQSYDRNSGDFDATVVSAPTQYRNWLVFTNSGSAVPSASGQYDIEIYLKTGVTDARWGFTNAVWGTTDYKWETAGEGNIVGDPIYQDRAYISGSNESSITQYVSPDENGTYTTYNG